MPTVWLIEDDLMTVDLYKEVLLSELKIKLEITGWGEEAIKWLKSVREKKMEKPDLILLDLVLPDISGLYVLDEIRNYPETKDIKVIVITNLAVSHYKEIFDYQLEEELNQKADKVVIKVKTPPSELIEIVKDVLKEKLPQNKK